MKTTLLIVLCLIAGLSFGQRQKIKESNFDPSRFKTYTLEIEPKILPDIKVGFSSVIFLDNRADTSKLGFIRIGEPNDFHRFVFPAAVSAYMTEKTNKLILPDSGKNAGILFSINHFWMAQEIIRAGFGKTLLTGPKDYMSYSYVNMDCYLVNNDGLQFLGNIDTVLSAKKWMGHYANELVKRSLTVALQAADSFLATYDTQAKKISLAQLSREKSIAFPILTSQPNKGIFLSYEDFLNNNAVSPDFSIDEKKKKEFIVSATVDTSKTNNAWGYSDGAEIYIHINDAYYRMVRSQRTFEFAGPRHITKLFRKGERVFNLVVSAFFDRLAGLGVEMLRQSSEMSIMKELVPYQLNIKDGAVY